MPVPDSTQHSQQTPMPPVGFEPTISAGERPQTYALDRAATGTGILIIMKLLIKKILISYESCIRSLYKIFDWTYRTLKAIAAQLKNCIFGVSPTIELRNVRISSDNTITILSPNTLR